MIQETEFDVIIVGGGLAGLTAGVYLAKEGRRVLLCEKEQKTGGLVNSFEFEGFLFDAGIRAMENSGIILPMLRQLGIELPVQKSPVSVGIGDQMVRFGSEESLAEFGAMLEHLFPGNGEDIRQILDEIRKVMKYMDVLYGIDNPLFLDQIKDPSYLLKTLLPWFVRYQFNIRKASRLSVPVNLHLSRLTENQSLIDMITQHFFHETPAFFALSYFGFYLDYLYPDRGTGALPEKMTERFLELGGTLALGAEVLSVDPERHVLDTSEAKSYRYRKLLWAANLKSLYERTGLSERTARFLGEGWASKKEQVLGHHGNDSILTLYLGVDLPPETFAQWCGPHCFYTPETGGLSALGTDSWRRIERDPMLTATDKVIRLMAWSRAYLDKTTYEISIPVLRNPELAPDGQTGLAVSTLFDYDLTRAIRDAGGYEAWKEDAKAHLIEVLDRSLMPGLRDKVKFGLVSSPLTLERFSGNADGAITGWAFAPGGVPAESRFKKISKAVLTPAPDIYQAGMWTFSPAGLPVAILTGKLAADLAHKELGAPDGNWGEV